MRRDWRSRCAWWRRPLPAGLQHDRPAEGAPEAPEMNTLAQDYVRLVLAMGQHDADYVDAYYGPPEWKPTGEKRPLGDIDADATALQMRLAATSPAGRRRAGHAAPPLPDAAAVGAAHARRDAVGHQTHLRSGIEGALRRRGAAPGRGRTSSACSASWSASCPGAGRWSTATTPSATAYTIPKDKARRHVPGGDRGLPGQDAGARPAAARRELHPRVRDRQELERLQLVPGQLPQPDPGQHRSADPRGPRRRSGVSRRLSRPSRLQRAARAAPRARARLARVLGLRALLAAVAHRRGHRQLRRRRGVSRRRASASSSAR